MRVADAAHSRRANVGCVIAKIRHSQVAEQNTPVGMWIRAHAPLALRRKFGQFRFQEAPLIKYSSGR